MRSQRSPSQISYTFRWRLVSAFLLLPLASANSFNCKEAVTGDKKFNFGPLAGPHSVSHVQESDPNVLNTTYTVNICGKLLRDRDVDSKKQCAEGTWICGITNLITDEHKDVQHVLPVARQYESERANLDPKLSPLPDKDSNADSKTEGLRVILGGGQDTKDNKKVPQKAVIEFLCRDWKKKSRDLGVVEERDEKDDKPKKEWEAVKTTDDGHDGTLKFIRYDSDDKEGTLHLEWNTKFACRDYPGPWDDSGSPSSSGGWGFFSWIFFLGFMGLLGYFLFFAWLNYNKYGATGWDLVPHSDTIRDLPYVLKEWGHKVIGSVTGGPSRGGYSAV